jgi:hypothetical protein
MPSAWITHVKKYAQQHKISYKDALKKAASTYKKLNNFYLKKWFKNFSLKK